MPLTQGQAQLNGILTLGLGTEYHLIATDFFSWPSNRSSRTPAPTQSGWVFDPIDLFSGRTASVEIIIKAVDRPLLSAMRELSEACTQVTEGQMLTLDMFLPHDDGPKRLTGRVRDLAFPEYDRKTYGSSTLAIMIFETELPHATSIAENSRESSLAVSSGGHTFNATFNQVFGASGSGGSFQINNAGNTPSSPIFRINGPVTNPRIFHQDLDRGITFNIVIAASDFLLIDVRNSEILLNGTASRYFTLTNSSRWFNLSPGVNNLFYSADTYDADATLTTLWYDAYRV